MADDAVAPAVKELRNLIENALEQLVHAAKSSADPSRHVPLFYPNGIADIRAKVTLSPPSVSTAISSAPPPSGVAQPAGVTEMTRMAHPMFVYNCGNEVTLQISDANGTHKPFVVAAAGSIVDADPQ